jgi:hypothetical protein
MDRKRSDQTEMSIKKRVLKRRAAYLLCHLSAVKRISEETVSQKCVCLLMRGIHIFALERFSLIGTKLESTRFDEIADAPMRGSQRL